MLLRKFLASEGTLRRRWGRTSRMFPGMFRIVSMSVRPSSTEAMAAPLFIIE